MAPNYTVRGSGATGGLSLCSDASGSAARADGRGRQLAEGDDPPQPVRRDVPVAVVQPLAGALEPASGDVELQDGGALDPAAVPLDRVQDRPGRLTRRAEPGHGQLA